MSPATRGFIFVAGLALFLGAASGCRALLPDRADKAASFEPYASAEIDGVPLASYLSRRTVVVVGDPQLVTRTGADVTLETGGHGSAAPIAADGYFLTAAHCLAPARAPHVLLRTGSNGLSLFRARVVWAGDVDGGEDLALIKVDGVRIDPVFAWAEPGAVTPGAALVSCGYARAIAPCLAAGAALDVVALGRISPGGPPVTAIAHSVPITSGDSGGPLATRDGRLAGINVRADVVLGPGWRSAALRPDPAWIAGRIRHDREAAAAAARSDPPERPR